MREIQIYKVTATGKENWTSGLCAGCAVGLQGEFLFANFAMPVMAAKSAAAMLRGTSDCRVSIQGFGYANRVSEGYRVVLTRLPKYTTCQLIAIAKRPNLLLGPVREAIWRYITSQEITTPVLDEWRDYIVTELITRGKVGMPNTYQFEVCEAKFTTDDVDKIVSMGLKKRKLRI